MSKSSLLNRLAGVTVQVTAAEIERRLEVARSETVELERRHQEAAIDAAQGGSGSAQRLAEAVEALSRAAGDVRNLEAALAGTREREAEAARKAALALWDSRKAAFDKQVREQEADARTLADAIAAAVPAYRRMLERIGRICAAHPNNAPPLGCAVIEDETLCNAITDELNRLWTDPKMGENMRFPGCTRLGQHYDPSAILPLMDVIREATEQALKSTRRPQ